MVYSFADANAPGRKHTQYFENAGGRGIYHDGWFAGAFGPLVPWDTAGSVKNIATWDADTEPWQLYDLSKDYSQADDLAASNPEKLAEMKTLWSHVSVSQRHQVDFAQAEVNAKQATLKLKKGGFKIQPKPPKSQ